ncbi:hypothetical protein ACFXKJ_20390 [Kitasatospora indigofera]|uniref:hypothetical protein n=1 Tax=Kitasatospora indigofera TaxID=67307 RepID=UPI0036AD7D73
MPRSTDKALAHTRMHFLSEPKQAALAAVPRDGTLGIDTCSREQLRLRALLALGLFNRAGNWQPHRGGAAWGLHTLVAYDIVVSAQFDQLVLITDVPHNVAPYLLPRPDGVTGLPGLRLDEVRGSRTYLARHQPTGGRIVITGNRSGTWSAPPCPSPRWDFLTADIPLAGTERSQLARLPEIGEEAAQLLAGLVCRLAARDPQGGWAIGNWFSDPLARPGWTDNGGVDRYEKQLGGPGHRWTLRWSGFPFSDDVADSLTSAPIGIPGAVKQIVGDHIDVRLGPAVLRLSGRRAPVRPAPGAAL